MFSLIFDKLFLQLNFFEQNLLLCFKLRLLLLKIKHLDFHPLDITHGASIIPFKIAELIPFHLHSNFDFTLVLPMIETTFFHESFEFHLMLFINIKHVFDLSSSFLHHFLLFLNLFISFHQLFQSLMCSFFRAEHLLSDGILLEDIQFGVYSFSQLTHLIDNDCALIFYLLLLGSDFLLQLVVLLLQLTDFTAQCLLAVDCLRDV